MPGGGVLTLAAGRVDSGTDGGIEITVKDSGPGISGDDLPHVFEPFFTTKEEGKGVGLGLAVVHGIARRHGGTASVSSTEGEGATFVVRLPITPPEAASREDEGASGLRPLEEVVS
jgi:signal transduction histidine kinase